MCTWEKEKHPCAQLTSNVQFQFVHLGSQDELVVTDQPNYELPKPTPQKQCALDLPLVAIAS
jgi:hypothetical protein